MAAVDQVLKEKERNQAAEVESKAAEQPEAPPIPIGDVEALERQFGKEGSQMLVTLTSQVDHLKL